MHHSVWKWLGFDRALTIPSSVTLDDVPFTIFSRQPEELVPVIAFRKQREIPDVEKRSRELPVKSNPTKDESAPCSRKSLYKRSSSPLIIEQISLGSPCSHGVGFSPLFPQITETERVQKDDGNPVAEWSDRGVRSPVLLLRRGIYFDQARFSHLLDHDERRPVRSARKDLIENRPINRCYISGRVRFTGCPRRQCRTAVVASNGWEGEEERVSKGSTHLLAWK